MVGRSVVDVYAMSSTADKTQSSVEAVEEEQTTKAALVVENTPQPASQPVELIQSTDESLRFLEQIGVGDFKNICFEESLEIVLNKEGGEVGEFKVNVAMATYKLQPALLVQASSHGTIDEVPCGTSVVAYVSPEKLVTLEQQHHEYVSLADNPLDRKTFLCKQKDGYRVERTLVREEDGEEITECSKTLDIPDTEVLITEGSNMLLQRILVQKGLPNNMRLICLDTDLNLCHVNYGPLHSRKQIISATEVTITGIERKIISSTDMPICWQSYFLNDGRLVRRFQVGSPTTVKLRQLPSSTDEDDAYVRPTLEKKGIDWERDDQMHSKFLDRREELRSDHATYTRAHPELRAILDDYMQYLLLRKPADTIAFAAEYFSSLSARMPKAHLFKSTAVDTPHPLYQTNSKIRYFSHTH